MLIPLLCFVIVLNRYLFVYRDNSLTGFRIIERTEQPTKCLKPFKKLRARIGPLN